MFVGTPQRALGIDPGLVRTGWAVLEPVGYRARILGHGVIAPPTDAMLPARLAFGAQRLREVLAEFGPSFVAVEEVFTAPRHPRSALLMAHMRGVICLVLEEAGLPILSMTATTVKQRLTSSGHASKEQVQRMVQRLTGFDPSVRMRLDETDAMALALAGLYQQTHPFARMRAAASSRSSVLPAAGDPRRTLRGGSQNTASPAAGSQNTSAPAPAGSHNTASSATAGSKNTSSPPAGSEKTSFPRLAGESLKKTSSPPTGWREREKGAPA